MAGASYVSIQSNPRPVGLGSNYITSIQPWPALMTHILYWLLSPVCWTDPDSSVVSLPWPVNMYHILFCYIGLYLSF